MLRISRVLFFFAAFSAVVCCRAQSGVKQPTLPVVMLSDLHFDPFQDPAKLAKLRGAPIEAWPALLSAASSPKQATDFAALQATCKARGADSSWGVLTDGLKAAHTQVPKPLFVTVSGDLLAHSFDCRMRTLAPDVKADEIADFAAKTVSFVAATLRKSFPGVPVFLALGNNDSGCTDYQENPNSTFLKNAAIAFASDAGSKSAQAEIHHEFSPLGNYDVALPAPLQQTRLIVLQDMFQSRNYAPCGGAHSDDAAKQQIDWLRARLADAKKRHEAVWVMAHIPPGVDVYASFHKFVLNPSEMCSVKDPTPLLGSDALADAVTDYADIVRLAVFAHTHMDEMKLLHNASGAAVAAKIVPSISPVNGNTSAFTVAQVEPASSTLKDYTVYARGLKNGPWAAEYTYSKLYGMPDYSAASVKKLTSSLVSDKAGDSELSRKYERWFFPGDTGLYALGLHQIWSAYACAAVENGGAEFHNCMCGAPAAGQPAADKEKK